MINIFISIMVFLAVSVIHVGIYRMLKKIGIKSFKTVIIYVLGFLLLSFVSWPIVSSAAYLAHNTAGLDVLLPFSSLLIYLLVSILAIMFFTSPYTGDISPTLQIIRLLKRNGAMSNKDLLDSFSADELIDNRLRFLVQSGYVQKKRASFYITPKGLRLISVINMYRKWIKWKSSG